MRAAERFANATLLSEERFEVERLKRELEASQMVRDLLRRAYEAKIADFAAETRKTSELATILREARSTNDAHGVIDDLWPEWLIK